MSITLSSQSTLGLQRYSLLIINNDLAEQATLADYLARGHARVLIANDGAAGLEVARREQPDLILLATGLPEPGGFAVGQQLRLDEHSRDIPIIYTIKSDSAAVVSRVFQSGGADYLSGPFQYEEVLARIMTQFHLNDLQHDLEQMKRNLEEQVEARTAELMTVNQRLQTELIERRHIEETLRTGVQAFREMVSILPAAVYVCDAGGLIESYNRRAVELWGREPRCGDTTDRFCGSYRIYTLEGTYLPHDQCPMAQAIYSNNPISNAKIVIERPDGTRRTAMVNIIPRRNTQGLMTGAINCLTDITDLREAEERISASLREKETLLKEIHHRVKNNLQVLYSLLTLQADLIHSEEGLKALNESRSRVMSIALIHEQLYRSEDLARIDFAGYVDALTAQLFRSYGVKPGQIERQITVDRILLSVDQAIPCGLIINELVSNALKHAFPASWEGPAAEILVSLTLEGDEMLTMVVSDTGIGLPQAIDLDQPKRLGLQLVTTLTRQLHGTLTLDRLQGTTFRITFPQ